MHVRPFLIALALALAVSACASSKPLDLGSAPLEIGVVSGSDGVNEAARTRSLGAPVTRLEFHISTPPERIRSSIAAYARTNTRVLLLAGFHADVPTRREARRLVGWAREFGPGGRFWRGRDDDHLAVTEIEFGNETNYGWQYGDTAAASSYARRARWYADRLRVALRAFERSGTRTKLLAQAEDQDLGRSTWIDTLFRRVPRIGRRIGGWTVHAYGPRRKWEARMDWVARETARRGGAAPMWMTEWGIASADGRCLTDNYEHPRCLTYEQAGAALTDNVVAMRARYGARLRAIFLYRGRDGALPGATNDREQYFGLLRWDMRPKGAYTDAATALIDAAKATR